MALLEIKNIRHQYGKKIILDDLTLNLERGHIGCLLGPSGVGKTTILRVIAGFESILSGEILIDGRVVSRVGWNMPSHLRKIGIVFQDCALFPHLTVRENIDIGLRHLSRKEANQRVTRWMEQVGLSDFCHQYPHELSGGEAQRVALARAMAPQPLLLLLDEPFSNLDEEMREHLSAQVRSILKEAQTTAFIVTHHQNEAFALSDDMGVFHHGKILQWGSSYHLYHEPADRFVADFIGEGSFLPGKVINENIIMTECAQLRAARSISLPAGDDVEVLLRPDDVIHDDQSKLQAKVIQKRFRGAYILYTLLLASGHRVLANVPSHHNHAIGSSIGIRVEADHVIWF